MNTNGAEIPSSSIQDEQLASGDMCPSTYMYPVQIARPGYMFLGDMCPGVNAALGPMSYDYYCCRPYRV